ncbi:VanZ family protein [Knoellia sp. CPCC 206453]|uniref:VanZ family protein n=1 Tax=Knoellia pratensis TaxID=3404796 RepID=UPI00361046E1
MTVDRSRRWSYAPVLVAVVLQFVLLYSPSGGGASPFPNFDKLVHCSIFALPVFFALLARLPWVPVIAVLALHAPVSELLQWALLPHRSGDPWDVVADLVGMALGAAAAHLALNREQTERW